MRSAVLLAALALAHGVEEIKDSSMLETAAKNARATGGSYTVSAAALKQRVKAEAEKAGAAAGSYSMSDALKEISSMTQADRLNDMAAMILPKEGEKTGEELVKALSPEGRANLAELQSLFTTSTAQMLEKLSTTESVLKPKSVDPKHAERVKEDMKPIEGIMAPLMSHIELVDQKHAELKPFTSQVTTMMSLFEQKALNELFSSNLPQLQEFKKESFATYTPEHKAQIEDVCEMLGFDDMLTVLRDPSL